MKKKLLIFRILYYILSLFVYIGFFYAASKLFAACGDAEDLGSAIIFIYSFLFIATPALIAVLMRFSLLRWYVDPLAAAEVPLFLYFGMIFNQMKHTDGFNSAFLLVNRQLCDDGGMGWLFLGGLFIFGLLASFSLARKRGESISYKLLSRILS